MGVGWEAVERQEMGNNTHCCFKEKLHPPCSAQNPSITARSTPKTAPSARSASPTANQTAMAVATPRHPYVDGWGWGYNRVFDWVTVADRRL